MKAKKPSFTQIIIKGRVPERPLNENERLAAAMGFINVQFADIKPRVRWCGKSRDLTKVEFARVWSAACKETDDLQAEFPGSIFWPDQEWQDTSFLTGQKL